MSKSKTNKCKRVEFLRDTEQAWFLARRKRNRVRDRMAKESRRINRGT